MQYAVVFTPEAQDQLAALYRYIATAATPEIAEHYTNAIVTHCDDLSAFPNRGARRDDIRPGLRITNYKKRAVIAFAVDAGLVRRPRSKCAQPLSWYWTATCRKVTTVCCTGKSAITCFT